MSRNFEMLQEIGGDEELFSTSDPLTDAEREPQEKPAKTPDEPTTEPVGHRGYLESVLPESESANNFGSVEETGPGQTLPSVSSVQHSPTEKASTVREIALGMPAKFSPLVYLSKLLGEILPNGSSDDKGDDQSDLVAYTREAEAVLVRRVFPGTDAESPRVAVFTSIENGAGCASICVRAAKLLADRGEGPVCLIDANLREPSLHRHFGVENQKGFVEAILERSGPLHDFATKVNDQDLWLMTGGKASIQLSTAGIEDSLRVRLAEARNTFWYVVIHAGQPNPDSTTVQISRWADGVVLVVEAGRTRREVARRAKEGLLAGKAKVLGVVLNNRTFPIPQAIYQRI